MARFLISYDLIKRKDYPELIGALTRSGAVRALRSQWFVDADNTTDGVYAYFRQFVDADDLMLVVQLWERPLGFIEDAGAQWVRQHWR